MHVECLLKWGKYNNNILLQIRSILIIQSLFGVTYRWRLENLVTGEDLNITLDPDKKEDYVFQKIREIVQQHNEAIK